MIPNSMIPDDFFLETAAPNYPLQLLEAPGLRRAMFYASSKGSRRAIQRITRVLIFPPR